MFQNRTYLPSGQRTPRAGGTCVAKNGALKVVSSRMELPDGRFAVRLTGCAYGSAKSSVTDAAENRANIATFLILALVWLFIGFFLLPSLSEFRRRSLLLLSIF